MASSSNPGSGFGFPPPDTGNFLLNWISRALVGAIRIERRFDPFFRPARRQGPPRSPVEIRHGAHQQAAEGRGPGDRRGTGPAGRGGPSRRHHRELRRPDPQALEPRPCRARREHEDARHRPRGGHGPRRPAGGDATRHLRGARAHVHGVGALRGPRPVRAGRHRRRRLHEHEHQAHGRAGPEAARGRAAHAGLARHLDADLRHAGHESQREASALELQERADLLLPQLPRVAHPRLDHAAPLDEDPDEPARGRLLQLRAVPARGRPGDAVLVPHEAEVEDARAAPALAPARQLSP